MYKVGSQKTKKWLTAALMVSQLFLFIIFYGWFFLSWSFHKWYIIMSNTTQIFSILLLFHCSRQVVTNCTLISETSVIPLLLKTLPLNATEKLIVKFVKHKPYEAFFNRIWREIQLGRFFSLTIPFSQQLPRLTSLYPFEFLRDR